MPLFDEPTRRIEAVIERFENAWLRGEEPCPEKFVEIGNPILLLELLHVDLEHRIERQLPIRVESYAERFPEILTNRSQWLGLIKAEFQLVRRHDPRLNATLYRERFGSELINEIDLYETSSSLDKGPLAQVSPVVSGLLRQLCRTANDAEGSVGSPLANEQGPLFGRFRLVEVLGQGAFGTVFRARDSELQRDLALKIPHLGTSGTSQVEQRFLREGRSMARLDHPGIVKVYEVGKHDNIPFIASELIEGRTLATEISQQQFGNREVAEIVKQIADALDHSHQHGIVHRDLKPANVLLQDAVVAKGKQFEIAPRAVLLSYRIRLTDFGLAHWEDAETIAASEQQLVGTLAYMSPEQTLGRDDEVGAASDIFSLGVIMYELLTGERPFRGRRETLVDRIAHSEPISPRSLALHVDSSLETICLKCLQKSPGRRYASAKDLAEDLRRWQRREPIAAKPSSMFEKSWARIRNRPTRFALGAVSVLSLVLLSLGAVVHYSKLGIQVKRATTAEQEAQGYLRTAELQLSYELWKSHSTGAAYATAARHLDGKHRPAKEDFAARYLHHLFTHDRQQWQAHEGPIAHLSVNEQSRQFASASADGNLKVWSLKNPGEPILNVRGPADVLAIRLVMDRLLVVTATAKWMAWEVSTGALIETRSLGDLAYAQQATISADGNQVALVAPFDSRRATKQHPLHAVVFDMHTGGHIVRDIPVAAYAVNRLEFAPVGRQLLVDHLGPADLFGLQAPDRNIYVDAGSPDGMVTFAEAGEMLVGLSESGELFLWDASTGGLVWKNNTGVTNIQLLRTSTLLHRCVAKTADNLLHLWDLQRGVSLGTIQGCGSTVTTFEFDESGQVILTGAEDGTITMWPCRPRHDADVLATTTGHTSPLKYSPDGKWLAAANNDHTVTIWNTTTWQPLLPNDDSRTAHGISHRDQVNALAFSPDSTQLISVGADRSVFLTHLADKKVQPFLDDANTASANDLAFSPQGEYVHGACSDGTVKTWESATGRLVHTLPAHDAPVNCLALAENGHLLITADDTGRVRRWTTNDWEQLPSTEQVLPFRSPKEISPMEQRGELLISTAEERLFRLKLKGSGDIAEVPHRVVEFSPDHGRGRVVLIQGATIHLLDLQDDSLDYSIGPFAGNIRTVAWSPVAPEIAVVKSDGTLEIWNHETWQVNRPEGDCLRPPTELVFSANGSQLLVVGGTYDLWTPHVRGHGYEEFARHYMFGVALQSFGKRIDQFAKSTGNERSVWGMLLAHHLVPIGEMNNSLTMLDLTEVKPRFGPNTVEVPPYGVSTATFLSSGEILAGSMDNSLSWLDGKTGEARDRDFLKPRAHYLAAALNFVRRIGPNGASPTPEFDQRITRMAVNHSGNTIAAIIEKNTLVFYDAIKKRVLRTVEASSSDFVDVHALRTSYGAEWLVCKTNSIQLLSTNEFAPIVSEKRLEAIITASAVSQNGKLAALGTNDHTIQLWDLVTMSLLETLHGHSTEVVSVCFDPNNEDTLFSGSEDGGVKIWDLAGGGIVLTLPKQIGPVCDIALSPNSELLVTATKTSEGSTELSFWSAPHQSMTPKRTDKD